MTYEEAREFIDQSNQYGSKLGLETITELMRRLGNPQDRLRLIHVAGTNGKGSTTAFISSILAMEGYRVGRYISPAVFSYREKIQICSKQKDLLESSVASEYITEEGVIETIEMIRSACEAMVSEGWNHPTSFELETAMAMLYFDREKVDYGVIEVGLGGRLDATNIIRQPLCCVITSISMDHMEYLGNSIELIAKEKAGIIKKNTPVITNNKSPEVLQVLMQTTMEQGGTLSIASEDEVTEINYSSEITSFQYHMENYAIRLLGEYQISNAILAILTAKVLRQLSVPISDESIKNGLRSAIWRGRFEIIKRNPLLIIDGAHNADAALKLRNTLELYYSGRRIIFIMGVLADKDYKSVLKLTAPLAQVIITVTPNNNRALSSKLLASEAGHYTDAKIIDAVTVPIALEYAYQEAGEEDIILAFGSLSYLREIVDHVY